MKKAEDHRHKTVASLQAIRVATELGIDAGTASLRARLGSAWTLTSALQWLTGNKAWQDILALPDGERIGGLTREQSLQVIYAAGRLCFERSASAAARSAIERAEHALQAGLDGGSLY